MALEPKDSAFFPFAGRWITIDRIMVRRHSLRRLLAASALAGWVSFAGGGEVAELFAQALGFHGDCRMPCCREQANAACPRMRGPASDASESPEGGHSHHAGHAVEANDASFPSSSFSLSAPSSCEEQCASLSGAIRSALSAERIATPSPPADETARPVVTANRSSVRFLTSVPSRAPPA
jgi:hypothetical protein